MTKASCRSMLIIAAGIWMGISGPVRAAPETESASEQAVKIEATEWAGKPVELDKSVKRTTHFRKRHFSQHRHSKVAGKSSRHRKLVAADTTANEGDVSAALPPAVANANAEWASADTSVGAANVMSARANAMLQTAAAEPGPIDAPSAQPADNEPVAADQLNDVDRAFSDNNAPSPRITMASANDPAPATSQPTVSTEESAWSQSSIIGKVFIAFGGLLTLASAARMFMS